jgi:hypothetical protein
MTMRWSSWVLGLALGLAASGAARGQALQSGDLVGTLTLDDGQPAAGVEVTVTSPSLQGERSTVSQGNGDYILRGLPPGEYTVRFALAGLRPEEKMAIIPLGGTVRTDARLSPETVSEQMVVTGDAGSVLVTPTVGGNLTAETVDALAISRDLLEVAKLTPGVTGNTPNAGQVTISGGLAYDNLFLLDGADIKDNVFGDLDRLFIEDAIEEVQVLTGAISAEYGRFGGGVINAITKSGGNEFEGSLRADLDNPSWREKTPFEERRGTELTDRTEETYSATLGGYILKDRLWFFSAGRDFDFTTQRTLNLTGIPYTDESSDRRLDAKLTARLAEGHSFQASYLTQDSKVLQPSLSAGVTLDTLSHKEFPAEVTALRYSGVLGAAAFVTAHYSEKESEIKSTDPTSRDLATSPILCVHGNCLYNAPYFDPTDPEHRDNRQTAASLSYFLDTARLGSHNLKLGAERFTDVRVGGTSQSPTDYTFMADPLFTVEGDLVLDEQGRAIPVFNPDFFATSIVFWEAIRGARLEVGNDALYLNDDWKLDTHWSFNLGARYDQTKDQNTEDLPLVDTDRVSPRLAVSFDPGGDGKYRFDASYAEYTGSYNLQLWAAPTATGNPGYLYGPYVGPPGQGRDFAPGFDPGNYLPLFVGSPNKATSIAPGTHAPVTDEYTLSAGMQLSRNGFLRLTFQDRRAHDLVEDYTEFGLGTVDVVVGGLSATTDRKIFRNSDLDGRHYRALLLQGRYRIRPSWTVEGNWTHQLRNHGNYEGEGASVIGPDSLGDYPELFDERNFPEGRLDDFQADIVRLWTIYVRNLGRAGDLTLSLLGNYYSPRTYSLVANGVNLTPQQLARDPGYAQLPFTQRLFFGERGSEEFNSWYTFDTAAIYGLPILKRFEPWVKLEVRNLLDDDTLIGWNTTIVPLTRNPDGSRAPVDSLGRPTTFHHAPQFGSPRSTLDFPSPREYRFAVGLRF